MTRLVDDRYGYTAAQLNAISAKIKTMLGANLQRTYRTKINRMELDDRVVPEITESVDEPEALLAAWRSLIMKGDPRLNCRLRQNKNYWKLEVYIDSSVTITEERIGDNDVTRYSDKVPAVRLLDIIMAKTNNKLSFVKYWT